MAKKQSAQQETIDTLRSYFGSITEVARRLKVNRASIYDAVNGREGYEKLADRIDRMLTRRQDSPNAVRSPVTNAEKAMTAATT
jgi:hypothetical protein